MTVDPNRVTSDCIRIPRPASLAPASDPAPESSPNWAAWRGPANTSHTSNSFGRGAKTPSSQAGNPATPEWDTPLRESPILAANTVPKHLPHAHDIHMRLRIEDTTPPSSVGSTSPHSASGSIDNPFLQSSPPGPGLLPLENVYLSLFSGDRT